MKSLYDDASKRHEKIKSALSMLTKKDAKLQSPREPNNNSAHIATKFAKRFEQEYQTVVKENNTQEISFEETADLMHKFGCITTIEDAKNNKKLMEFWQQLGGGQKVSKNSVADALRAILLVTAPAPEGQVPQPIVYKSLRSNFN